MMGRPKVTRTLSLALIFAGIVCGVFAIVLQMRRPQPAAPLPARAVTNEPVPVSEKPRPAEVKAHTAPPDLPKYISIPSIGLPNTRVFPLGLNAAGRVAAPGNIHDAGWYKASAKPGQAGATFMYGHLSNWQATGAFHELHKLKPGNTITIVRGDDRMFTYSVKSLQTYPADKVPMATVLSPAEAGRQSLNLMTCAGKVIKGTNDFDQRLVVYATLVGG